MTACVAHSHCCVACCRIGSCFAFPVVSHMVWKGFLFVRLMNYFCTHLTEIFDNEVYCRRTLLSYVIPRFRALFLVHAYTLDVHLAMPPSLCKSVYSLFYPKFHSGSDTLNEVYLWMWTDVSLRLTADNALNQDRRETWTPFAGVVATMSFLMLQLSVKFSWDTINKTQAFSS